MTTLCRHCNKPEREHHEFQPSRPGCVCDPPWFDEIDPICGEFKEAVGMWEGRCETCRHDRECHGEVKE